MLLKSIKLHNFRQFMGIQEIEFSIDNSRNVTMIMGENGSGKTTFAQAFTWCFYGDTDFTDKSMLNKLIEEKLSSNQEATVSVEVNLSHSSIDYVLTREQIYRKDSIGKIKESNTVFKISYKKNGQQEFLNPLDAEVRRNQILPQELSKYFFFDGERIEKMSKEVKKGKSQTFGDAVRGLLGLSAFIASIEHLKPTSKYSVIGSYNESYDASSDTKIVSYNDQIQGHQDKIDSIDVRLVEIEKEIDYADERCDELNIKIQQNAESEVLQKHKNELKRNNESSKLTKNTTSTAMFKNFNRNAPSYFSSLIIKEALELLVNAEIHDKGIPEMNSKTIEFLIERGYCICGNKIEKNNNAYQDIIKTLNFIPPKSIGITVGQFIAESNMRLNSATNFYDDICDNYSIIRDCETIVEDRLSEINTIEQKLEKMMDVSHLQQDLKKYEKIKRERLDEIINLNREKGSHESLRDIIKAERAKLTLKDQNNRKIEIYKAYAQYMYVELLKIYKSNEDIIRNKLEKTINEIFKNIYQGGLSLTIDEKYNIQVLVEDYKGYSTDIETSTAQNLSVIFAFISGIIKIAKDNSQSDKNETVMLESEPYPLVMDAPLSAFDKRRIKTVCDELPKVAEQVIIFIKDTDGDIAEKNMGDKVGKRYMFDKKNEFETHLISR